MVAWISLVAPILVLGVSASLAMDRLTNWAFARWYYRERVKLARSHGTVQLTVTYVNQLPTGGKIRTWVKAEGKAPRDLGKLYVRAGKDFDVWRRQSLNPKAYWCIDQHCWLVEQLSDPLELLASAELE